MVEQGAENHFVACSSLVLACDFNIFLLLLEIIFVI